MKWPRGRGAEGVLAARTRLIKLVLPAGAARDGGEAVAIMQAIDLLERAAHRDGRRGVDLYCPPAPPVTAAELAAVRRAIEEHQHELEERRRHARE